MKNYLSKELFGSTKQILRKMKATFLMLVLCATSLWATNVNSQVAKVNISLTDARIVEIIKEIENQTDYLFVYDENEVNTNQRTSITVKGKSVDEVLTELFSNTKIVHLLEGNNILLMEKNEAVNVLQDVITISGKVTDSKGEPLPGVNIVIQGTTQGTITDFDGNYSLDVQNPTNTSLVYKFIGYNDKVISVGNQTTIDVVLEESFIGLEEVVAVGYGVQKKSDVTGAISKIKSSDMENRTSANVGQALQGKSAGTQVIFASGAPGSETQIRIRGFSSNAESEPLYIVDGLKVTSIDYLDPDNIESIEILKDAASAAIYGAEAGNGVVLVTTKSGGDNGRVFYNMQYSITSLAKNPSPMNAQQYADYMIDAQVFAQDYLDNYWDGTDTDWSDVVFTNGVTQRHTFGFEGGNDRGGFYVSVSSLNNNGIVKGNNDVYTRLTSQVNADYKIKDWLKVGLTNSIERGKSRTVSEADETGSVISNVYIIDPLTPDYYEWDNLPGYIEALNETENLLTNKDGNLYGISYFSQAVHPKELIDLSDELTKRTNVSGTFYANLTPIKDFVFTSRLGYRLGYQNYSLYEKPYYVNSGTYLENGALKNTNSNNHFYQFENFANYSFDLDKNTFSLMAGMSYQESRTDYLDIETNLLTSEDNNFQYISNSSTAADDLVSGEPTDNSSISYFGRIGWAFDRRYSVQGSFRADAFDSSKLSTESRWGYFPSVSAAWTISNENFMKDVDFLSHLKLRGSWGINGNVNVLSNYVYSSYLTTSSSGYDFSPDEAVTTNAVSPSDVLANPKLKWETSKQLDLGMDSRFLKDRLTFSVDFYSKNTDGLLTTTTPPLSTGASTTYVNAGKVHNHGFEIELDWKDKVGDFNYNISANIATLNNEVKVGPSTTRILGETIQGLTPCTAFEEGFPIWYIRGYKFDHVDQSTGQAFFKTADGGTSATPSDDDKGYIGDPVPDFTYGITLNMDYKNFDLVVFGSGSCGSDIMMAFTRGDNKKVNRMDFLYTDAWSESNTGASRPSPYYQNSQFSYYFLSDAMVYKASYFKIKQIQLGYTVPKNLLQKIKLANLRAYVSLDDFFTFTDYPGFDPETRSGTTSSLALDKVSYPVSKKVVFGLNVSF